MKLDLGCGENKPSMDWTGIDRRETVDADIVQDLEENPNLPFEDNSCEKVQARHFLEHLSQESLNTLLEEVYRVLKPDGVFVVVAPHFLSWNSATVDHKHSFGRNSFDLYSRHTFPSQCPDLFKVEETNYILEKELTLVYWLDKFFKEKEIATYIPNSVREIKFKLKPLQADVLTVLKDGGSSPQIGENL